MDERIFAAKVELIDYSFSVYIEGNDGKRTCDYFTLRYEKSSGKSILLIIDSNGIDLSLADFSDVVFKLFKHSLLKDLPQPKSIEICKGDYDDSIITINNVTTSEYILKDLAEVSHKLY